MPKTLVGVRLSSETLRKIDERGKRSDIIRKAIDNYLSEGEVKQLLNEIKGMLKEILERRTDVHIHLPESFRTRGEPKRLGFWGWLKWRREQK